jgi:hypothetical protein
MNKFVFTIPLLVLSVQAYSKDYDEVFPEYFEYCAASQVKYTKTYFEGSVGGPGGHGFLYVHGLCKDNSKGYPQVKPCEEEGSGVGISLDSDYANVKWIAVPGRDLMMNGNHSPEDINPVSLEEIENVKLKAYELEIFKGVELKAEDIAKYKFGSKQYEMAAAEWSIGTDLALRFGRELRCTRTPISKSQVSDLANYLNAENDKYYKTEAVYEWSFVYNNCSHLTLNAGASIGINQSIKADQSFLKQLTNIAVPANAYMSVSDQWTLKKLKLRHLRKSDSLKKYSTHPNQFGSLMQKLPAFKTNHMFLTDDIKGISIPRKNILKMFKTAKGYDKYLDKKENTDLEENAKKWVKIYQKLIKKLEKKGDQESIEYSYLSKQLEKSLSILK